MEQRRETLCRWEMGDPMKVLMSRQQTAINRSCAGCANARAVQTPFGDTVLRCLKGKPYGKKCNKYEVSNG
ncbi:hypothetical protein [Achromobacter sp. UMC46]|uniref:hypothetical protein n=1 Tax=Achromobacter sp. UMC46 TaxID=1862319 RepID=UPI0016029DBE|nr:hypothetical protein [Achromobacter sp. UMC46]